MSADGSVLFEFDANVSPAERQLGKLKQKIEDTEKELDEKSGKQSAIKTELELAKEEAKKTEQEIRKLNEQVSEFQRIQQEYGIKNPIGMAETVSKLREQEAVLRSQDKDVEKLDREYTKITDSIRKITEKLKEAKEQAAKVEEQAEKSSGTFSAIEKRIIGLAKRVFVFTLITNALRSMRDWLGEAVKTNSDATAAIARLKGALLTLAQPLVNVIIPAFMQLVNVLTAVIGAIANVVSGIFGTTVKQSAAAAENLNKEKKALSGVGSAAKKAGKSLASFDEINQLADSDTSAGGGGGGAAQVAEIAPDFSWMDEISERLKGISDLIMLIGIGFALWKIGSMLPGVLGEIATSLGLIMIAIAGILLYWDGLSDAWENGVDWLNLIEMVGGLAAAAFALYQLFGPMAAGIALVVGGLGMLITAFHDAMENGWNLQNTLLAISGIVATGLGFAFITSSVIPLVIAGIASLLLAFAVATGHGEELLDGIRSMLDGFIQFFKGIFTGDIEMAIGGIEKIFDGLGMFVGAIIDGVKDTFLGFLNWLDEKTGGKLHGIIELAKSFVTDTFDNIKNIALNFIDALKEIFSGLTEFIFGVFTGDWDRAWDGVKSVFSGAVNAIITIFEGIVNGFINVINGFTGGINLAIGAINKIPGVNIEKIPKIPPANIPRLAEGAVIPPNREFMAILGDQKSGTNIEAPAELIRSIVREELGRAGNQTGEIKIVFDGNMAALARVLNPYIEQEQRRAGASFVH